MKTTERQSATPAAVLLASAFLITCLIILQAGRVPENRAHAGDAIAGDEGYTVLTVSSGFGKDTRPYEFCYVLDNHDEMLYIYEIPQASDKRIVLRQGTFLPGLFAMARGR
jgi:hypothetical protein